MDVEHKGRRRGNGAKKAPITMRDWMASWFETRRLRVASKTLANERSHARRYFAPLLDARLEDLSPGQIEDWLARIERTGLDERPPVGSPHTVRVCHSLLSVILRDAVKHRFLAVSPMSSVDRPKVPRSSPKYLELDEVRLLIDTATATGDPRALAVLLMTSLGLRRNEALGLCWSDIDMDARVIRLRYQLGREPDATGHTLVRRPLKTSLSSRDLRFSGELATALEAHLARQVGTDPNDYVISFGRGSPVDPDGMTHWLAKLGSTIGITVSPHRLRHTSATLMLNAGIPLETVGKVLGHAELRTTAVYARVLDETSFVALDSLAELLEAPGKTVSRSPTPS